MNGVPAAFFDVDGTIVRADIVRYFVFLRTLDMAPVRRLLWTLRFLPRIPYYILLDKFSRTLFNQRFYRNYSRFQWGDLQRRAQLHFREFMEPRIFPEAVQKIRQHQSRGHTIILVTGSLEVLVQPLAKRLGVENMTAARLERNHNVLTGRLQQGPITGECKAREVQAWVKRLKANPADCFAYADSLDDAPMLEQVGHPSVINPGSKLAKLARRRGWNILNWSLPKK